MLNTNKFLENGGQMGRLLRSADFSNTSLGFPDTWPDSLRSAISISLNSGFPIAIYWGNNFTLLYNDPYSAILGDKHPGALGKPGHIAWSEIWAGLDKEFRSVLTEGTSIRRPDALLLMNRYGYTEECYFDYTLSPIIDMDGTIGGVFNAVIETTYKVINERRSLIVQLLLQQLNNACSLEESLNNCIAVLESAKEDIPFYVLYTSSGNNPAHVTFAKQAGLSGDDSVTNWPYENVFTTGLSVPVTDVSQYLSAPVMSVWGDACREALIASISKGDTKVNGYLIMGVSPRKRMDSDYQNFLESVALHIGIILNNGYLYQQRDALQREQVINEELAAANEELNAINEELHQSQDSLSKLNIELEDRVAHRTKALDEREEELQALNEELTATNEELTATIEELATANEELASTQEDLLHSLQEVAEKEIIFRNIIEQAPVAIGMFTGRRLIITAANDIILSLWGKSGEVIGKPLAVALPELEGQPFLQLLDDVFTSGQTFYGNEVRALLEHKGVPKEYYFNFAYQAVKENNIVTGIIAVATDVTEQVQSRLKVEESELSLRSLVMTAHYSLMILRGRNWVVEVANQSLADLWSKTLHEITGRPLLEILPEISDQPFPTLLKKVYDSGEGYGQEEEVFYYNSPAGLEKKYVSFYYDPMFDTKGKVSGIIVAAEDITSRVEEKLAKERTQQMLDMAIESAELGTWFVDAKSRKLIASSRLKEIFGFDASTEISFDDAISHIADEHRDKVVAAIEAAITKGENYDIEYSITGLPDQKLRWVRATGKLYQDADGKPGHLAGTVLDITERKLDDIRKNDFIAMVSHELKTPLTSMKAYVQMISLHAKQSGDAFTTNIVSKAHNQVNKMTTMINSFLNVARLEAGKIHLEKTRFNLKDLVAVITEDISVTMHSHAIHFTPCQSLFVNADYEKIGQVITNLISNAIKYSAFGKHIEIACRQVENMAEVCVKDEGVGIKPQDIDKLFERYYRVENTNTQIVSGFGIGLYLSAEIVQRHNGRIWVESEIDKGSVFYFTIPLA